MNTWKVILATLVIFGAGVVTGGLLVGHVTRASQSRKHGWPSGQWTPAPRVPGNVGAREPGRPSGLPNALPQLLRKDFLQNLDRQLKLTEGQHEQIERILSEGQERNRQLWEPIAPQIRKEMQEVKARILAVLTPEQRARFEELMKQRSARRGEEPSPAGPPRDMRRPMLPPEGAPQPLPPAASPPNP